MKNFFMCVLLAGPLTAAPWQMHVIDNTSRGADGVRLADINGDGRPDIATGWEEGGVIRAYMHPGKAKVKDRWPMIEVGQVRSPEDAVFADLDGDGDADIVSSSEGRTRAVHFHWSPRNDPQREVLPWRTEAVPVTAGKQSWMFAVPMNIDEQGMDLVLGSKGAGATIGWLRSPKNPRDVKAWTYHPWYNAGWIMSLIRHDMDGDSDLDVLASDRRSQTPGVLWLENPGPKAMQDNPAKKWTVHHIGAREGEVMFITQTIRKQVVIRKSKVPKSFGLDFLTVNRTDAIYAAVRPNRVEVLRPGKDPRQPWASEVIEYPLAQFGTAKAARAADLDGDGKPEIAVTCEAANGAKSGAFYLKKVGERWEPRDIGGPKGLKYDRIELVDLDGDGDLDLLTCEERDFNAVLWYENPHR